MEVLRAKSAGFCMGVDLALRRLDKLLAKPDMTAPIYTFGPLIHNPQVIAAYAARGVRQSEDPEAIEPGSVVLIRAHGIPKSVYEDLRARNLKVKDATCPKVMKAQRLIAEEAARGGTLLLYGEENHPEVRGLLSHAPLGAIVFDSLEELQQHCLDPGRNYFLAAQTTQDKDEFERISEAVIVSLNMSIPVLQTICDATMMRQQEAISIARSVEHMVVVGGYNSGNTRRLVKVVEAENIPCVQVETPHEMPLDILRKKKRIGLTAGASTPKIIIDAVESMLHTL